MAEFTAEEMLHALKLLDNSKDYGERDYFCPAWLDHHAIEHFNGLGVRVHTSDGAIWKDGRKIYG